MDVDEDRFTNGRSFMNGIVCATHRRGRHPRDAHFFENPPQLLFGAAAAAVAWMDHGDAPDDA